MAEDADDYRQTNGSFGGSDGVEACASALRRGAPGLPLIQFPATAAELTPLVDAVLLLSLVSGRNPQYLIEEHVRAVPFLRDSDVWVSRFDAARPLATLAARTRKALTANVIVVLGLFLIGAVMVLPSGFTSKIAGIDLFDTEVRQLSGSVIPNRWRAGGALDNIGGDLQAGAATLRFSLGYLRDYGD